MNIQSKIPKTLKQKKNYFKRRNSFSYSYSVYESTKYEHVKAINHFSYTSPVKTKVLKLHNDKTKDINKNKASKLPTEKLSTFNNIDNNTLFKIHQLVPNTGPAHGGIQVTIHGQGFYDGLYVVYGNCIIETEFIDSNTMTFYLPPNPKCYHYNGKKTVVEDLFVVDLYKSLISHTEFNTNISDSFNIMLEIIMKIMISRVCNNFNELSSRKTEDSNYNINKSTSPINEKCHTQKQHQKTLGININLFNFENNSFLNSLKTLQNSISCSFNQQEKTISSLINKTREFIPTFYISNTNNKDNEINNINQKTILSHKASSLISTVTYPVIKIDINPSITYHQPCNYCQGLIPSISESCPLSLNSTNINLNSNSIIYSSLPCRLPINKSFNNKKSNNNNRLITSSPQFFNNNNNNSISSFILSNQSINLSKNNEEIAIDGDDEMDDNNNISFHSKCTCNHIGTITKSTLYSYRNSNKKSIKKRHKIISSHEKALKEHKRNYIEGKKIEKFLEECVKKSNEAKQIQPNEFFYSSTLSNQKSRNDLNVSSNKSKRLITVKITLIHLGIILCMTRLIYYVLKYCKLCYRVQNCADDVSTKLHDLKNNIKKDNTFCLFKKESETTIPSNFNSSEFNHYNLYGYNYNNKDSTLMDISSATPSPSSSSNILTPMSSSNDSLSPHNYDTQIKTKTVKTKRRTRYIKIIDQGDTIGNTPLHYATIAHSPALFNMLIEAGANINKENIYGQTVLDLAYSIGDDTMVELIEEYMNCNNSTEEENENDSSYSLPSSSLLVDSGFSSGMNEGLI